MKKIFFILQFFLLSACCSNDNPYEHCNTIEAKKSINGVWLVSQSVTSGISPFKECDDKDLLTQFILTDSIPNILINIIPKDTIKGYENYDKKIILDTHNIFKSICYNQIEVREGKYILDIYFQDKNNWSGFYSLMGPGPGGSYPMCESRIKGKRIK